MPPSGPGTIYPFADKAQFDSTYRAICTHKNMSLDLSHLVLDGTNLDLHQLHLLVFKLGGEAKVSCVSARPPFQREYFKQKEN